MRSALFFNVSVYGSRVPLRGPGMTRRISVRSVDSQQAFSARYETPRIAVRNTARSPALPTTCDMARG